MRKNSIKNTRINGEVQRELSRIISREIKDPRIAPMTSVVDAVVTSDLKQCKAYISVLGNDEEKEETMKGLNSAGLISRCLISTDSTQQTKNITTLPMVQLTLRSILKQFLMKSSATVSL